MSEPIVERLLGATTGAFETAIYRLGQESALPANDYPHAQIIETLDGAICPLCRAVHGMILDKSKPEYDRWRLPSHINCRRILVDIHRDEVDNEGNPTQGNFNEPPDQLISQHGHFVLRPKKFAHLRLPARPTGLDFIVKRGEDGAANLVYCRALAEGILRQTLRQASAGLVTEAIAGVTPRVAELHSRILTQVAQQGANRQLWDDLGSQYLRHAGDWGRQVVITQEQYQALPAQILANLSDTAVLTQTSAQYGEMPLVVFRARGLQVGAQTLDEVTLVWDVERSQIYRLGRLPLDDLQASRDWTPLKGDWS